MIKTHDENGKKLPQKVVEVYTPDRPLLLDAKGVHIVESDTPHTQLGTRTSKDKGKYPQAREFGDNGEVMWDLDFTEHNKPDAHPIPHRHRWVENKTGGTKTRNKKAEPLEWWNYD